jgi:hypothetical protein
MKTFWKIMLSLLIAGIMIAISQAVVKAVSTNYVENASVITITLAALGIIAVLVLLGIALVNVWRKNKWMLVIFAVASISACNYAKSNQQVLVSDDCGITWKKIDAGEAVPKGTWNPCYVKIVVPNYPMQGQSSFISNFSEKVRAKVILDYDYSITEALSFIKQAKTLGRANADPDDEELVNTTAFESAENRVIDVRLRDVVKRLLLSENIVDVDQSQLEQMIQDETNKVLKPYGVELNFITLTFDLDEQTRQAIDVATAIKIYDSKGISEVGKLVMTARAGATKVIVENKPAAAPTEE